MTNSVDADPAELIRARTEAINLVQWLARIANSKSFENEHALTPVSVSRQGTATMSKARVRAI